MAYTGKNYLDYAGLQTYDGLIKTLISTEDAKSLKYAAIDSTGNYLLLYKTNDGSGTPAFSIPMGSADLRDLIESLGTAVGATLSSNDEYSVSFTGDIATATTVKAAVQLVNDHIGTLANLTTTEKTTIVGAINEVLAKINALDANVDVTADTADGDFYVLTGVDQADGLISKGDEKLLKKVASTAKAEDLSNTAITDGAATNPQTLYAAGDVQTTLTSIARNLNDLESEAVVTLEKQATAESGYFATYVIKQNGTAVGGGQSGKINIPKDFLVKSASVETVTVADQPYQGAEVGDKYIDFVVNTRDTSETDEHIYLPVDDLMSAISGGTTTVANMYELQVSVDSHNQITATLNNIYGAKVLYTPTSATTKLTGVTEVAGALDTIDTLIQGMDADLNASTSTAADAYGYSPLAVMSGVTEVDGIITSVDSADADPFGQATAAYNAIGSIATADINALFTSGS